MKYYTCNDSFNFEGTHQIDEIIRLSLDRVVRKRHTSRYPLAYNIGDFVALAYFVKTEGDDAQTGVIGRQSFLGSIMSELVPQREGPEETARKNVLNWLFAVLDPAHKKTIDWRAWRNACRYNFFSGHFAWNVVTKTETNTVDAEGSGDEEVENAAVGAGEDGQELVTESARACTYYSRHR